MHKLVNFILCHLHALHSKSNCVIYSSSISVRCIRNLCVKKLIQWKRENFNTGNSGKLLEHMDDWLNLMPNISIEKRKREHVE